MVIIKQTISAKTLKRNEICSLQSAIIYIFLESKELWGFGSCLDGQLGIGKIKYFVKRPFNISRFTDKRFLDVTIAQSHALSVTGDLNSKMNLLLLEIVSYFRCFVVYFKIR